MKNLLAMYFLMIGVIMHLESKELRINYNSHNAKQSINIKDYTRFEEIYKTNETDEDINVYYKLAYDNNYLYFNIIIESDTVVIRDRAYQNGDGFHITIARPKENNEDADEFYVFGFSPKQDWSNKIIWYYNIDLFMRRLTDNVIFNVTNNKPEKGLTLYELQMPWDQIKPFHPLFTDKIGINICFVKAVNENDKIFNFLTTDYRMQSEQSKRKYVVCSFDKNRKDKFLYVMPDRFNIQKGDEITLTFKTYPYISENMDITIALNDSIIVKKTSIDSLKRNDSFDIIIDSSDFSTGLKTISIYNGDVIVNKHDLYVIEQFDYHSIIAKLDNMKNMLDSGSFFTLSFYTDEIKQTLDNIKFYDNNLNVNEKIVNLNKMINLLDDNNDPVLTLRNTHRRAFLSEYDNTLRPYSVYIPETYNKDKSLPLLVYLHGSGDDDRVLFHTDLIKEDFIVLAPNGRGTSNCFATDESQLDVFEAINDLIKNFNIDVKNIVLSGFSMGGYGVYRTFYERPDMFKAIAIISGHPNLAEQWNVVDEPVNFLEPKKIKIFKDIPVFIFHGKNDRNCPFELTEEFVHNLNKVNSNITFIIDETGGHGSMKNEQKEIYHQWLLKQIESK